MQGVDTNYIVYTIYLRHHIYNSYGALQSFFVDGSGYQSFLILIYISLYLLIKWFVFQSVFFTVFALIIPFIQYFYNNCNIIICCTRSKIVKFKIPHIVLQFSNVPQRYICIKCVYTAYIVHIRYLGPQIDNLYSALLPFLVDASGVAIILISSCYLGCALDLKLFLFIYKLGR